MKLAPALAVILLASSTTLAAAEPAKDAIEKAEKEKKKEKKICRTEKVTGSRTRVNRICLTRAEWDAIEAKTRDNVGDLQRNAAGGANSSWNPGNAPGAGTP